MSRQIDIRYAEAEIKALGPKMAGAVGRGLYSAAIRGVQVITSQIIPRKIPTPVDRGIYRAGWRHRPIYQGGELRGGELFNLEPHAAFIEGGVRASNVKIGRAMIQALAEWAKRKGLATSDVQATRVAWAIALTAKKQGLFNKGQGLRVLEELMTKLMPAIAKQEIATELAAALKK